MTVLRDYADHTQINEVFVWYCERCSAVSVDTFSSYSAADEAVKEHWQEYHVS